MVLFDRQAKYAFIVATFLLGFSGVGFRYAVNALNVFLEKEAVPLRDNLANVSRTLGNWQKVGQDARLDEAMLETLNTEEYLSRSYAIDGESSNGVLQLHLAYYTGFIDAVPHVPDRCFEAGGLRKQGLPDNYPLEVDKSQWRESDPDQHQDSTSFPQVIYAHPVTGQPITVHMPAGDFSLRVTEFQRIDQQDVKIFAGYFFIANGETTATPERLKFLAFDPTERYAYYLKVQYTMFGDKDFSKEEFISDCADFTGHLLPELMRCLPDWYEVQFPSQTLSVANDQ